MISNVRTRQLDGEAVVWDGTNLEEVQQVAGESFVGVHVSHVLVQNAEGIVIWVMQGWTIARIGEVTVTCTPDVARLLLGAPDVQQ